MWSLPDQLMAALFSYKTLSTPLYSSQRCCRYLNMTQHKFSIMCFYTLPKSVFFPDVLISRNYIPSIELLSQNLENHLNSFSPILHLLHSVIRSYWYHFLNYSPIDHFSPSPLPLLYPKATIISHLDCCLRKSFHTYGRVELPSKPIIPQLKNLSMASHYP